MECPICKMHELLDYSWQSDDNGTYRDDEKYSCANCGGLSKDVVDAASKRIAELERYIDSTQNSRDAWHRDEIARLEAENQRLREAAKLALHCKTLPEAARAKAALEEALREREK